MKKNKDKNIFERRNRKINKVNDEKQTFKCNILKLFFS